jgi:divalent metal cation (Fe/Co/Zn/Cd) transporter
MGGYYSHAYFKLVVEKKIQTEETAKLRREIEKVAKEQDRSFCSIL